MKIKLLLLLFGAYSFVSCDERADTRGYKEELKNRQIKRVTSEQVTALADIWGKNLSKILNNNPQNANVADSLAKHYAAEIRFLSPKNFVDNKLNVVERQVLEAYQYNAISNITQTDNVQKLDDGGTKMLFTSPVFWSEALAKLPQTQKKIFAERNQLDSLDFRKTGDWIGIWCMTFQKKELIRRTDMKALDKLRNKGIDRKPSFVTPTSKN